MQNQYSTNTVKLCECGCGQPAPIAKKTHRRSGHTRGQPVRFIAGHNNRLPPMQNQCTTKRCSKCREVKELSEFNRNLYARDGYHNQCKVCHRQSVHESYLRHKEKILAHKAQWKVANRAQIRERDREYYAENRERILERNRNWYARSPHVWRANKAVQCAILRGDLAPVTNYLCRECGNQATDYHHPSYKPEDRLKVIPLCRSCHQKKHAST